MSGESPSISAPFFEDNIDATNAPESEEVTKKVTISINDTDDSAIDNDIESYKTKRAVLAFWLTAPDISPILFKTWYIAALPNTPIHIKTINDGTNKTPIINSLIVLP